MPVAPAASCALVESTRVFTTVAPGSPGIPARNGFNGFLRALPGDRACLPPSSADIGCLSPVGPTCLRKLDASVRASGPHDFAVRSNRLSSARSAIAHGFKEPALRSPRAQNAAASAASRPAFVTIMIRPSVGWDGKSSRSDLGSAKTEIFLQRGLDCQNQTEKSQQIALAERAAMWLARRRWAIVEMSQPRDRSTCLPRSAPCSRCRAISAT